jgi:hypothetical protein
MDVASRNELAADKNDVVRQAVLRYLPELAQIKKTHRKRALDTGGYLPQRWLPLLDGCSRAQKACDGRGTLGTAGMRA